MSSFMDRALSDYRPPAAEEMDLVLPIRREPKAEQAPADDARELGQHGGSSEEQGAADAHSEVASASTNEATPQRDDPDDGEHTDSTAEQVAARARQTEEDQADEPVAAAPVEEPALEIVPEPDPVLPARQSEQPVDVPATLRATKGTEPKEFKRIAFSSGEDTATTILKRFPQPLIDRLRLTLASSLGGEFAEAISAPALVSAYLLASIGGVLDVDENTAAAAEAFRRLDPRVAVIEDKVDETTRNIEHLADLVGFVLPRVAEVVRTTERMDYALAYLVADRVAGLSTADVDETNVDVTTKKALVAREQIAAQATKHRTIEKQQEGRRLA